MQHYMGSFHFDQVIPRNQDRLKSGAEKNRAITALLPRTQILPLHREDLHGVSGTLMTPEQRIVPATEK